MIVGFGTGGGVDLVARLAGPQLERRIGRHVRVENRPGGTGAGAGEALKADPNDGSILALMPSTTIVAWLTASSYPFNPLSDTTPITTVGAFQLALAVSPKIGVSTLAEYIDWLKVAEPERRRIATNALAPAFEEFYRLMLGREFAAKMEIAGYRNGSGMLADLEEGRVPAAFSAVPTFLPSHRGRRLRIVATTGRKRISSAPGLPTVIELGYPGLEMNEWFGFYAGAHVASSLIEAWNLHLTSVLEQNDLKYQLAQLGVEVETSSPEDARARVVSHLQAWKARLGAFGLKITN